MQQLLRIKKFKTTVRGFANNELKIINMKYLHAQSEKIVDATLIPYVKQRFKYEYGLLKRKEVEKIGQNDPFKEQN